MSFLSPAIPKTANFKNRQLIKTKSKSTASIAFEIISTLLLALSFFRADAQEGAPGYLHALPAMPPDSLRVSVITCWPGQEIYELEGHEAIRVASPDFDYVWNYGTFDFQQPNFIGRFVSGQTDYMVMAYPFAWFMPEYVSRGSRVEEQELLLSKEEKQRLYANLRRNALPQNNTYRYNYVKDNCATRITAMLDTTLSRQMVFPDSAKYGTFRRVMRHYHRHYPWYQLGIDLVLGSGLDRSINRTQEMFAPVEMHDSYANAFFAGSRMPVAAPPKVLYEGKGDVTLPPTPWYLTPTAVSLAALLLSVATLLVWLRNSRLIRWWMALYFGVCGLAGCLVTYLVFFSTHEATSPNLTLVWLNPLQLVVAFGIWWRSWRVPVGVVTLYNVVAIPTLLIIWPSQSQVASLPIFVFMLTLWLLSAVYIIFALKMSYYYNVGNPSGGAASGCSASGKRSRTGASSAAKRKHPARGGKGQKK